MIRAFALTVLFATTAAAQPADDPLTRPLGPQAAARWTTPQEPVKLHGNTYYVGFGGLSLALIRTGAGLILIDGGVPQGVPAVKANIRKLGFKVEDIRYVLSTEAHWDHSGGIAAFVRDSGGTAVASPWGARALRKGESPEDDPQAKDVLKFPAVARVREIRDGQSIKLGGVTVTAHDTPGHTPGSTSWSWKSCEAGKCVDVVFSSSLNPISSDGFHFTPTAGRPDLGASFRRYIRKVGALPCDILISAHPEQSGFDQKLKAAAAGRPNAFIDPASCRAYAARFEQALDARLSREKAGVQ
jgi:metallo-beta-lactamase class B